MRKRITSLLLTLVMLLSLVPAMGVTASAADDTYGYGNIKDWSGFKSYLSSPTSRDLTLENDIDYTTGYDDDAIIIKKSQKLDLNGHKIRIDASKRAEFYNLITIRSGEFTLYDSKGGGAIEVEFARDSKGHCIIMISPDSAGAPAKFTMNGGTLTRLNPLKSGAYGNNGCISDNYFVPFKGGERPQITINGGTINCAYDWNNRERNTISGVQYMPTALLLRYSQLTVNGGTFNGIVWTDELSWREGDAEPRVLLNGGVFNFPFAVTGLLKNKTQMVIDGARFNDGLYVAKGIKLLSYEGNEPAMLIKSGVFDASGQNLKLDIRSVTADGWYTAQGRQKAIKYAMKLFPNSAIKLNGNIYTSENIGSRVKYADTDGYYLNLNLKGPIEVIPNAWGMKSVTLDGNPINYFKDWKGTVENLTNDKAHTLKFEWYPLASDLVNAGYTYRTKCEHYISGSSAVQQTDTIDADKTSHTITIEKGAHPKVYSYDLQLNLDKNGSSVGIISNEHIVKLVVSEAADTFISTVSFNVDKADVGAPGELSFEATDKNGKPVAINPDVTWDPTNIKEGINHVSFTIPAPDGYTFSGENGKITTLKFGGVDVIGYVDGDGALNYSFPLDVVHRHKADHVSYNAKYHWEACSCGQKMMNTSEKHNMGGWVPGATLPSGGVVYNRSCTSGCGYTETTIDYSGVKHVTSLVLNMENYPMDGMRPHNFVYQEGDEKVKDADTDEYFYKLTKRDDTIPYPSFSIATGSEKVKLSATNPEAYEEPATNPDFAKWTTATGTLWLVPDADYSSYEHEFKTGAKYKAHLTLDAKDGYAFYEDFKTNQENFKLYTDMEGITIEQYGVRRWYYDSKRPSYDDPNVPEGWGWYTQAPDDDSAGASRVQITFVITARNEGELNITLPELKAGDDLKTTWADFEGIGAGNFVKDCYGSETMAWWGGPSCVIHNSAVTGESVSVIAQAGQTYRLTIPAVNEYVLAHTTIKNPTAATRIDESPDGAITVTYKLPAAADDKTVNGAAVSITPPAYGVAPDTTATVAGTAHCTASAVTWNPTDAAFEAKEYTATVTLTANDGYTFASDAVFTINGHMADVTKNTDGSVTLRYTFPALTGPHTHTYGGNWIFATPDTHIRYCTANDGSYEEVPHSITSWTDNGDGTHTGTCTDCGYVKTENHSWVFVSEVAPTVTTEGTRHYKCSACTATKTESIPKLTEYTVTVTSGGNGSASADHAKAVAGTEIKLTAKADSGYHFKEWQVVKGGVAITDNKFTMPAEAVEIMAIFEKNASTGGGGGGVTTYSITVKSAKNGDVTASHKSASKGTTVTLTVDPDKGYVLDTLTVLDGKDKEIKLTEKNGKYVFTMPSGKVTVAGRFKVEQPAGKHPFTDIPSGAYYENAVIWAADKGITGGTSATTFAPNGICTRAQAVTFLWRAAGSPAPKSMNSFADVPADAYYAKAVAWAVENGITSGTGGGKFSPDATCTRAQIVTFLYRAAGSPAVSGGSVFSDVKAGAYYADAVTWAANKGITGGIGNGLFGSDNNCTRAQIVTFLYRYME
ncbi:S-layer homology domain-containing protein [Intestinimonas butyriciproducens]|uniref:S-layer family protein n=1 Tax=Intestinimonas butyriciproducens TaxID=1297617 RepID=A0A2U1CFQ1_9FIRM|nr:S-layer homology domain-containing protein [Intestinimonas butyriciproducens]MCR1904835.1 S-layer homology domain-containing protein [Intestinimonas butyriciproducens]PVY59723.1 S-layer family protein [Intestinimonas butyriciproducens]QBB64665.1 5'-nucleotidase [Intestinimonas butyriciproducens]